MKQKSTEQEEIVKFVSTEQRTDFIQGYLAKVSTANSSGEKQRSADKILALCLAKTWTVKQLQNTRICDSEVSKRQTSRD